MFEDCGEYFTRKIEGKISIRVCFICKQRAMDISSCRICLSPSLKFINIFGKFHGRSVKRIIEEIAVIEIRRDSKLPKFICEQCLTSFLHAESIIAVCRKNNEFLNELATIKDDENYEIKIQEEIIIDALNEDKG